MIDVSELLSDPDFVEEITVLRRTTTLVAGVPSTSELPETIYASVQPARGEDLAQLPEGTQLEDTIMVYTAAELRAAGPGMTSDGLVVDGRRYTVQAVPKAWRRHGFNGALAIADSMSGELDA